VWVEGLNLGATLTERISDTATQLIPGSFSCSSVA
jgi:hypothetical protein